MRWSVYAATPPYSSVLLLGGIIDTRVFVAEFSRKMVSKVAVGIVSVLVLTCCLVASEEKHTNQHGTTSTKKAIPIVRKAPKEVQPPKTRTLSPPLVSGFCRSGVEAKVCENASLPLLVFVVGIEGSGHHLLSAILARVPSLALHNVFVPEQHIYEPGEERTVYYSIIEKEVYKQRMGALMKVMAKATKDKKLGTLVYASSFPMGLHSGLYSTARPDLLDLKDFECELYRIKFLVTIRHPLAAVMSAVRRFGYRVTNYDGFKRIPQDKRAGLTNETLPYTVTARVTEDNLIYIDQQIRQLGCHQLHFVEYDKVINVTTRMVSLRHLAAYLELNESDTKTLLSARVNAPSTKVVFPPRCTHCIEKTLYDFFEERKMMWPLLQPQ